MILPLGATGELTQSTRERLGWRKGWKSGMQIKKTNDKDYCQMWVRAKRKQCQKETVKNDDGNL